MTDRHPPSAASRALDSARIAYKNYELRGKRVMQEVRGRSSKSVARKVTGDTTDVLGVTRGRVKVARKPTRAIQQTPNFYKPISRSGRPTTADGKTSLSIRIRSLSRTATHLTPISKSSAATYNSYIERQNALPAADKLIPANSSDHATSTHYIERDEAMAHLEKGGRLQPVSNIGDTAEERQKFWQAVDEFETPGRPDVVKIDMSRAAGIAYMIALDPDCPDELRAPIFNAEPNAKIALSGINNQRIRALAVKYGCGPSIPKRAGSKAGASRKSPSVDVDRPTFAELGLTFVDGRAGRTQLQGNGELPEELSLAGMQRAVRRIHDLFADRKLPTVAVIHAPDHYNNEKNWHFHLAAYDRPCERFENKAEWLSRPTGHAMPKNLAKLARRAIGHPQLEKFAGRWDFEVEYSYTKASRNKAISRPFYQAKDRFISHKDFPKRLREHIVSILNEELEREGHAARYDARTYGLMGIHKEPDEHLDKRASQLEKCGIPTRKGLANEERQWTAAMSTVERREIAALGLLDVEQAKLAHIVAGRKDQERLLDQSIALSREGIEAARGADELDLLIERASSRARSTEVHCRRMLDAIDAGKASKAEAAERKDYELRLVEAQQHLRLVDLHFAQQRADALTLRAKAKAALQKGEKLREAAYDGVMRPIPLPAKTAKTKPAPSPRIGAVDSMPIVSDAQARQSVLMEHQKWEQESLLHVARVERLDVTLVNGKLMVSEHPRLTPAMRQHIVPLAPQLIEVGGIVRRELDAFRKHLETGAAETPYVKFLSLTRPDIVTDVAKSRQANKATLAHAAMLQGMGR